MSRDIIAASKAAKSPPTYSQSVNCGSFGNSPGPIHMAFAATSREQVRQFHQAALAAGGKDNGAPGLREYHANYYGAFVIGPDGHNVEAVCHAPEA